MFFFRKNRCIRLSGLRLYLGELGLVSEALAFRDVELNESSLVYRQLDRAEAKLCQSIKHCRDRFGIWLVAVSDRPLSVCVSHRYLLSEGCPMYALIWIAWLNSTILIDNMIRRQLFLSAPKGSVCALSGNGTYSAACK